MEEQRVMKIIDWQCHFTEHQSHTWLALQHFFEENIIHIVAKTSSSIREKQGWSTVDLSALTTISFNQQGWWKQGTSFIKKYPDAIHVFGGFWADRRFFPLILYALWHGQKIVVMNESYGTEAVGYLSNSSPWRNQLNVFLRPKLYRMTGRMIKVLSSGRQFCLLAFSVRAAEQFEQAGFSHEQVFPFGYFIPKDSSVSDPEMKSSVVRIVFVGSLLKRKGLDLAVSVVESLDAEGVKIQLDVYGHGEADDYIDANSCCVAYKGTIPFGQAQGVIAGYDALILPSLHDGWGVVVNEALLQGVPVIVSSNVGAKCMVEHSGAGMVFESGDESSLKGVLHAFCTNPLVRSEQCVQAKLLGETISPEHAARYMRDVFEFYFNGEGECPKEIWE